MLKKLTKDTLHRFGYRLSRVHEAEIGTNPFQDIKRFLEPKERPIIFDVGANTGQSIEWFKRVWPAAVMHSFEPSPTTFKELQRNASAYQEVYVNNAGLGCKVAKLELLENTDSSMSSILEPGKYAWGELNKKTEVDITTLDEYCSSKSVALIDILKIDTQGYEYEVLQGATEMFRKNAVKFVYLELIFSEQYKNIKPAEETLGLLRRAGFQLVTFYDQFYQDEILSWTDALFLNPQSVSTERNGSHV